MPLAPPVAASVPALETPKIAKPAPLIAVPEAKPVEIVSAPPDAEMPAPSSPPVAASFSPPAQSVAKSMPPVIVARVPAAAATPTAPAETKPVEFVSAPPDAVKPAPPQMLVETPRSVPVQTAAKSAPPVIETPARPVASPATPVVEKTPAKATAEQLASLVRKPPEAAPIKPAVARPATPKPLEGFIIQLAFNDKESAQRWAEGMEKKGFAVSVTEAATEGALRRSSRQLCLARRRRAPVKSDKARRSEWDYLESTSSISAGSADIDSVVVGVKSRSDSVLGN